MGAPVFVMPPPEHLRAGAIWVEVVNWSKASSRRYGGAQVITPGGGLTIEQLHEAASRHGSPVARQPSVLRSRAETLAKDLRAVGRGVRYTQQVTDLDIDPDPRFVWQHHDLFFRAGSRLAKRSELPLVQFVDAPCVWEAARWGTTRPGWSQLVERWGERPQLDQADVVCCVSAEVALELRRFGVAEDRLLVTPCTADPDDYADAPDRRAELGLDGSTVVGWIGSFRRFHRLDVLIEAMAEARRSDPSLTLLLVGDGPDRLRTLALANELDVPIVAPGAVPHEAMPGVISSFDIAVIPAGRQQEFHYSPLKLKEYMASGKPVVAPAVGEMALLLRADEDVLLYEAGDVRGFGTQILRLSSDAALRQRLGEAGLATTRTRFSIDHQLEQLEERLARV